MTEPKNAQTHSENNNDLHDTPLNTGVQQSQPQTASPAEVSSGKDLSAQLETMKTNYLRAVADLENQKKRHAREREEFLRYGNATLIASLLPVVDNFEIALRAVEEHHPEAKSILEGLGMIIPQLLQTLKAAGVEVITPKAGDTFDPNLHQSVGEAPSPTVPHHAVLTLARAGYRLSDRLLRPAMVVLSSGKDK